MSTPRIQSALTGPALRMLDWFGAKQASGQLPQPEPLGNFFQYVGNDLGVDLEGYYLRDSALAYRDLVVGKAIEYVAKAVAQHVDVDLGDFGVALADLSASSAAASPSITVGQESLRAILATPIRPGTLQVTVSGRLATDAAKNGGLRDATGLLYGTIDYDSGVIDLVFPAAAAAGTASITWQKLDLITNDPTDIDSSHNSFNLGGLSGVRHVGPGDTATDALRADQHLYERDLIVLRVIGEVDANLAALTGKPKLLGLVSGPDLTEVDDWSQAEGSAAQARINFGARWSHLTFKEPDQHLAWRDNILARVAAELSKLMAHELIRNSERSAICAEKTGDAILAENATVPADEPTPTHWPTGSVTDAEPRSILPEIDFFVTKRSGSFQVIDKLHTLSVEVADSDLTERLERSGSKVAVAPAIGLAGSGQTALAYWITKLDPEKLVLLGNVNLPDGASPTMPANTAVWSDLITAGKVSAVIGPNDYSAGAAGTNLAPFQAKFGSSRTWSATTANGALEMFAVDAGLNRNMATTALTSNPGTLYSQGNTAGSDQALALKASLAASTAAWKVVLIAVNPATRSILQWPFKQWGVDAIITTPDSGNTLNTSLDGVPVFGCNGATYYFELYATNKRLQFRLRSSASQTLDSVTTFATLYSQAWQSNPHADLPETGSLVQLSRSADSGRPIALAVQDWELVRSKVSGLPRLYLPALAVERYTKVNESARYTTFRPSRPVNGRPLLTYDRLHRILEFTPAHSGFASVPAHALTELPSHRDTTTVSVALKQPKDNWLELRHKALRSNKSPCRDWIAYNLPPAYRPLDSNAVDDPDRQGPVTLCADGTVSFSGVSLPQLSVPTPGWQWLRTVALIEYAQVVSLGAGYAVDVSSGSTQNPEDVTMPDPDSANVASSPTNQPWAKWNAPIVAAAYRVRITWASPDGAIDTRCTLRLSSRPIASMRFVSSQAGAYTSDWVTFVSTSVSPVIQITRDRNGAFGGNLMIVALEFELMEDPAESDLRITSVTNGIADAAPVVAAVHLVKPGAFVFSSKWVDLGQLASFGATSDLYPTLDFRNVRGHLTVRGMVVQVKTRIENALIDSAGHVGYMAEIKRLLGQTWRFRQQLDDTLANRQWSFEDYTSWVNSMAFADNTFGCAFRSPTLVDLGRFCVVPRSLDESLSVTDDLYPELRVLDAALLKFGALCLDRCFDYTDLPPRPLTVITQDTVASSASVWSSDPGEAQNAAGLQSADFSEPDNSGMIVML